MLTLKTILHPTDFSESARAAYELACALARDHGARVVAVHVLPTPFASTELAISQQTPEYRKEVFTYLNESAPDREGVAVERRLADGDPASTILNLATEVGADLIVLGTHGRSGLWRLLMGSVAEEVLREATVPTLIVKQPLAVGGQA